MIPTNAVVHSTTLYARLKRSFGGSVPTRSDADEYRDALIEILDAECAPRWMIAAVTGLPERTLYRRLKAIKARRRADREEMAAIA